MGIIFQISLSHLWADYDLEKFANDRLPVLQISYLLSYPTLPTGQSPLFQPQNQTKFHPIRRRCPPDIGKQRRRFSFCVWSGICVSAGSCEALRLLSADRPNAPRLYDRPVLHRWLCCPQRGLPVLPQVIQMAFLFSKRVCSR